MRYSTPTKEYLDAGVGADDLNTAFGVRKVTGQAPCLAAAGEYNWGGAGGTCMWVDPKNNMFVVFMMQSPKQRVPYRSILRSMVYAAMER